MNLEHPPSAAASTAAGAQVASAKNEKYVAAITSGTGAAV